jgi:hypothetical protein
MYIDISIVMKPFIVLKVALLSIICCACQTLNASSFDEKLIKKFIFVVLPTSEKTIVSRVRVIDKNDNFGEAKTFTITPKLKKDLFDSNTQNSFKKFYPAYYSSAYQAVMQQCEFVYYPIEVDNNSRTREWWIGMSPYACQPTPIVDLEQNALLASGHNWLLQEYKPNQFQIIMESDTGYGGLIVNIKKTILGWSSLETYFDTDSYDALTKNKCGQIYAVWKFNPKYHNYQVDQYHPAVTPPVMCAKQYHYELPLTEGETLEIVGNAKIAEDKVKQRSTEWITQLNAQLRKYPLN